MSSLAGKRVCLLTSGHIASNPRLVKEADTLAEHGADVTVIALQTLTTLKPHDESLIRRRQWRLRTLDMTRERAPNTYLIRALTYRASRRAPRSAWAKSPLLAHTALTPYAHTLVRAAEEVPADLYIAHNLAALPAAFNAACKHGAKLGFDAEDLHSEELPQQSRWDYDRDLRRWLEDEYMPRCDFLTASSPQIAAHYGERFKRQVVPILNVFPLSLLPQLEPAERRNGPLKLHWFSQTVGPGRGLESVIEIMGRMREPCALHLRGTCSPQFRESVRRLAGRYGLDADRISFSEQIPPDDLPRRVAEHDIGLSTEVAVPLNRQLCLTNKIFMYLLSGIPVALSPTTAQAEIAAQLSDAAIQLDLAAPSRAAVVLDDYARDEKRLDRAKAAARHAAEKRFNWEKEKKRWLDVIAATLNLASAST